MIRALHHLVDAPQALGQVRKALQPGAAFILEFANKRNLKSILRFWAGKQTWNPFTPEPVEFAELNFDFHPKTVRRWLKESCFGIEKILTVSHFRLGILKRLIPARWLALLDGLLQPTGNAFQLTPSVFIRARSQGGLDHANTPLTILELFKCPDCGAGNLQDRENHLACPQCHAQWAVHDGIYDFRAKE
ncbi:MAG: hypothetical protein HGA28_04865 [Anaerolineaceae bacterium]|nr:hypothetical protein [Anaerolineaceae bacterium]